VLLAFCHLSQNAQVSRNLGDFDEVKVLIRLKVINSSFGKQDCYITVIDPEVETVKTEF
jgi:hypothetical protein